MRLFQLGMFVALAGLAILIVGVATTVSADPGTSDPLLLAPTAVDDFFPGSVAASTSQTTAFTYTVPAGREFRLERVMCQAATGYTAVIQLWIQINSFGYACLAQASTTPLAPGVYVNDDFASAVYFPAGTSLVGYYYNSGSSTGYIIGSMHGTEFNAP